MATEKRLIDANEIEDLFYKQVKYGATDLMDAFDDALQDAQTVDAVEVVHGRWEDMSDKREKGMDLRCSVCHRRASNFVGGSEDWWDMWEPFYCPNCGAKMDGERKDNV